MNQDDASERFRRLTRDLQRTEYLSERVDLAVADVRVALLSDIDPQQALRAALHYHLDGAWTAGAAERATLVSSVDTLRTQVEKLKQQLDAANRQIREMLKRISDSR